MKRILGVLTLAGISLLGSISPGKSQQLESKSYSADVMTFAAGMAKLPKEFAGLSRLQNPQRMGVLYSTGDKKRLELIDPEGDGKTLESIVIIRRDKNVRWILYPSQQTYDETSIKEGKNFVTNVIDGFPGFEGGFDRSMDNLVGTETIDGQLADKYEGQRATTYYYRHGTTVLLKVEKIIPAFGTEIYESRNIQTGEQSPDLFEIPEGYKKGKFVS